VGSGSSFASRKGTHEPVDLNVVVREAMRFIVDEVSKKRIALTVELAAALPAVEGNFIQLEQVVLNLFRNGLEALEGAQEAKRALVVRTFTNNRHEVELTIRDTGTGIAPDVATRLFEPTFTTKSGGLGIGLSVSNTIIGAHGGRIWVDPATGPGSTFHVALPIRNRESEREE